METQPVTTKYKNHRLPIEIISHAVWLYFRFCLSFRDVEELLFGHCQLSGTNNSTRAVTSGLPLHEKGQARVPEGHVCSRNDGTKPKIIGNPGLRITRSPQVNYEARKHQSRVPKLNFCLLLTILLTKKRQFPSQHLWISADVEGPLA